MEAAPDATATLPKNHCDTEQHIASLGGDWTFLRPNYFKQNMLMYAGSIARTNYFALPLGTAKNRHDRLAGRGRGGGGGADR